MRHFSINGFSRTSVAINISISAIKKLSFLIIRFSFILCLFTRCEENSFGLSGQKRNISSAGFSGGLVQAGSVLINSGDEYTTDSSVNVTFKPKGDADEMFISSDSSCSQGAWEPIETARVMELGQLNQENTVYVKYRFKEQEETGCESDSIIHDNIPPEVAFVNPPGPWTTGSLVINLSASDAGSGFKELQCDKQGDGQFEVCGLNIAYHALRGGDHSLVVRGKDKAGNLSQPKQVSWKVDATPPTFTLETGRTMVPFDGNTHVLFSNVRDEGGSGLRSGYECSVKGIGFSCNKDITYTLRANNIQKDTFQVTVFDNAGNSTTKTFQWQGRVIEKRKNHQVGSGTPKIDILFIVDTSASMTGERRELGKKIDGFISQISHLDWQIAATTTTVYSGYDIWSVERDRYDRCLFNQLNHQVSDLPQERLRYSEWTSSLYTSLPSEPHCRPLSATGSSTLPICTRSSTKRKHLTSSTSAEACSAQLSDNPYEWEHSEHSEGRLTDFTGNGTHILNSGIQGAQRLFGTRIQGSTGFHNGGGREQGIHAAVKAIQRYKDDKDQGRAGTAHTSFFREGADLVFVLLSDEDENSGRRLKNRDTGEIIEADELKRKGIYNFSTGEITDPQYTEYSEWWSIACPQCHPENFQDFVTDVFGSQKSMVWHSIIKTEENKCTNLLTGYTYEVLSNLTGGTVGDVCADDYTGQLKDIGGAVNQMQREIVLDCEPVDSDRDGTGDVEVLFRKQSSGTYQTYPGTYSIDGSKLVFDKNLMPGQYQVNYNCSQ